MRKLSRAHFVQNNIFRLYVAEKLRSCKIYKARLKGHIIPNIQTLYKKFPPLYFLDKITTQYKLSLCLALALIQKIGP